MHSHAATTVAANVVRAALHAVALALALAVKVEPHAVVLKAVVASAMTVAVNVVRVALHVAHALKAAQHLPVVVTRNH